MICNSKRKDYNTGSLGPFEEWQLFHCSFCDHILPPFDHCDKVNTMAPLARPDSIAPSPTRVKCGPEFTIPEFWVGDMG